DFSFSGLVNSARALLDALYEFGADEVAISEYVTNLEDAFRVAAAPQQ
ncbi:ead/Ea22-like family protein, partial [Salmonella enterica]